MGFNIGLHNKITPNLTPEKIKINLNNIEKLLGINPSEKEVKKLLEKMGYDYSNKIVSIPAYRTDILHENDIIEDIAIAYGYQNFEPKIPDVSTIGQEDEKITFKKQVGQILSGLGFLETYSHTLTRKQDQIEKMNTRALNSSNIITQSTREGGQNEKPNKKQGTEYKEFNAETEEIIELENSKTEYTILKKDLLHTALKTISENSDSEYPQKIFEIATIFEKDESKESKIKEQENLVISQIPGNFTELKQILNYLGKMLDLEFEYKPTSNQNFIEGRAASIILNNKQIGIIGEISPEILQNWKIKYPVSSLELNLDNLFEEIN